MMGVTSTEGVRVDTEAASSSVPAFRDAVSADLDDVLRLYDQLHPDDERPSISISQRTFDVIATSEWLHLNVLEHDGTVVATAYLNVVPNLTRGAAPYGVVENVVVEKTLRNRGYGQALMRGTLEQAWALGCYKVMLMTGSRREPTHNFYRTCGFLSTEKTAFWARRP